MIDQDTQEYYNRLKMNHTAQTDKYGWCMWCDESEKSCG